MKGVLYMEHKNYAKKHLAYLWYMQKQEKLELHYVSS